VEHHPATDSESTYAYDNTGSDELLDAPAVADDGVVDADYRVIIPPYSPAAEPATDDAPQDDDEWHAADDALTTLIGRRSGILDCEIHPRRYADNDVCWGFMTAGDSSP
jgi:hypothetical protein